MFVLNIECRRFTFMNKCVTTCYLDYSYFYWRNSKKNAYTHEQPCGDCNFTQGVQEEDSIFNLTSAQIGVLLTLVPPYKSFIMDQVILDFRVYEKGHAEGVLLNLK